MKLVIGALMASFGSGLATSLQRNGGGFWEGFFCLLAWQALVVGTIFELEYIRSKS